MKFKKRLANLFKAQEETRKYIQATGEQMKQTDAQMKQTDTQMKLTDAKLDRLGIIVGGISNSQGDVAEEFFMNTISYDQNIAGIKYDMMYINLQKRFKGIEDEFDIVLVNGQDVLLIEIKYKLHKKDIDTLLNKKIINFKKLYPEYKNYNHHLGLASFKIHNDVKQEALDNNIMVLQRKGDVIESFMPKRDSNRTSS